MSYYLISDFIMYFSLAYFIIGMIVFLLELAFDGKFHDAIWNEWWHKDYAILFLMEVLAIGGAWPMVLMFEITHRKK